MMTDLISDSLTRIRNAQRAGQKSTVLVASKAVKAFLEVLKKEGFIESYSDSVSIEGGHPQFDVSLKYYSNGQPLISEAHRISKAGRRVYASAGDIPRVFSGLGIVVVSTSKGLVSDKEARALGIGGELVASIG